MRTRGPETRKSHTPPPSETALRLHIRAACHTDYPVFMRVFRQLDCFFVIFGVGFGAEGPISPFRNMEA
jgi:hypothetical protein